MYAANPNRLRTARPAWTTAFLFLIMAGPANTTGQLHTIACSQTMGQAMGECTAAVSLEGDMSGSIVVTFENGFSRTLYVSNGVFTGANPTMSGTGRRIKWELQDNIYFISVDGQRYEIQRSVLSSR